MSWEPRGEEGPGEGGTGKDPWHLGRRQWLSTLLRGVFDGAMREQAGPQWAEESREGPCFCLELVGSLLERRGVRPWAGGTGELWVWGPGG